MRRENALFRLVELLLQAHIPTAIWKKRQQLSQRKAACLVNRIVGIAAPHQADPGLGRLAQFCAPARHAGGRCAQIFPGRNAAEVHIERTPETYSMSVL